MSLTPRRGTNHVNFMQERTKLANELKTRGNELYQKRDFHAAVDFYTRAIEASPQPDAIFYSNRAACKLVLDTALCSGT